LSGYGPWITKQVLSSGSSARVGTGIGTGTFLDDILGLSGDGPVFACRTEVAQDWYTHQRGLDPWDDGTLRNCLAYHAAFGDGFYNNDWNPETPCPVLYYDPPVLGLSYSQQPYVWPSLYRPVGGIVSRPDPWMFGHKYQIDAWQYDIQLYERDDWAYYLQRDWTNHSDIFDDPSALDVEVDLTFSTVDKVEARLDVSEFEAYRAHHVNLYRLEVNNDDWEWWRQPTQIWGSPLISVAEVGITDWTDLGVVPPRGGFQNHPQVACVVSSSAIEDQLDLGVGPPEGGSTYAMLGVDYRVTITVRYRYLFTDIPNLTGGPLDRRRSFEDTRPFRRTGVRTGRA
jgi:hypothetical protein